MSTSELFDTFEANPKDVRAFDALVRALLAGEDREGLEAIYDHLPEWIEDAATSPLMRLLMQKARAVEDTELADWLPSDALDALDALRALIGDASDGVAHLHDPIGVEIGRRFVKDDEAWPHRDDGGERQPLLLPSRQSGRRVIQRHVKSHQVEGLAHARPDLFAGDAEVLATERDLIADPREHDLRVGVLQDQTGTAPRRTRWGPVEAN